MNYVTGQNSQGRTALAGLRREMDRLLEDFWLSPHFEGQDKMDTHWSPACDVEEADSHFSISLEMAGIPKDQIKIEFHENQLVVMGERRNEFKNNDESHWYTERRFGRFQRTFRLPIGIDTEKVEANYQDGVLRIYIPKAESAKPRQIKINSGVGTGFFGKLLGSHKKELEESYSSPITNDSKSGRVA